MASGVSDKLWEISDIVVLWEAIERREESVARTKRRSQGSGTVEDSRAKMNALKNRFGATIIEAANRAEVTALLIRCGYRVYRPEADYDGEDLVVRLPSNEFLSVQLKSRAKVDLKRYGNRKISMLFPSSPYSQTKPRVWFLVPHDHLYGWVEKRHGHLQTSKKHLNWSYPSISRDLCEFLDGWKLRAPDERSAEISD
jgi:hypothetical protein